MQPQQPSATPVTGAESGPPAEFPPIADTSRSSTLEVPPGPVTTAVLDPVPEAAPQPAPAPGRAIEIAVVQFDPHTDVAANLAALRDHVRTAAELGARVVIAPEYSMFAVSRLDERVVAAAEPLTGPFVSALRGLAAEFAVHLVAGVVEKVPGAGAGRVYNTLVAATPNAEFAAVYRKVHLYDAFGFRESDIVAPGPIAEPAVFSVDGLVFGLQTCFDLRFPESSRRLAASGAQVLALAAQWIPGPDKVDQWTTLLRARAIENTVYVAASDHATPRAVGASMIIDPAGAVLAELGDQPGIATARVDPAVLDRVRAANPSLSLRRFEITPR